jgi:hypothetical protein
MAASNPKTDSKESLEALARQLHEIYQAEARRQGDVRHQDSYDELPDNVKEFDRVLARFIQALIAKECQKARQQFAKQILATRPKPIPDTDAKDLRSGAFHTGQRKHRQGYNVALDAYDQVVTALTKEQKAVK